MKILRIMVFLLLSVLMVSGISAQESEIEFEAFENTLFGIEGIIPLGWTSPAAGVYARGESVTDVTSLIIQSAPLSSDALLPTLAGQLGLEAFPEAVGEIETELGTWTTYLVEVEAGVSLNVTVAVLELDGVTYLALLQSTAEEHEALLASVFNPVIDSILVLNPEENEEALPYIAEDVTFISGDLTLAGTLTIPEGDGQFPVVLLVSGSGGQDRDESLAPMAEIKPFRDIADYLTRNGIAVLRYDDRGIAESEGDYASADIYDFRDDANAAINYLAERDEFSMIGIAGHSEGGIYAPEIAITNDNVDFLIGLAAPTVSLIDILREQNQLLFATGGADEEQLSAIDNAFADLIVAQENADADALRVAISALIVAQGAEPTEQLVDGALAQFTSPIFESYFEYEPTAFWLDVDVPTLAIYGSLDLQVSAEQNISAIESMNDTITIVTIENMNHIFQIAETGAVSEYGTLEQTVTDELLETLSDWILEVTAQ
ncbi:MAG: hypothetical protein Phog2KO_11240 [Phototrophicaceae bacterium]